jgi:predicted SprT family Zn-dependent metalloprotease
MSTEITVIEAAETEAGPLLVDKDPNDELYAPIKAAFQVFNRIFFDGQLPTPIFTASSHHKRSRGYFKAKSWVRDGDSRYRADVINLNPLYFLDEHGGNREALQTIMHEICHLWQEHFGKPPRSGYHNREFAAKMKLIGLQPSNTGRPGGKEVGQRMSDYIIAGSPFERAVYALLERGFDIPWSELAGVEGKKPPTRITYRCVHCGFRLLAPAGNRNAGCDCTGVHVPYEQVTAAVSVVSNT